jgi:hypothetical protein
VADRTVVAAGRGKSAWLFFVRAVRNSFASGVFPLRETLHGGICVGSTTLPKTRLVQLEFVGQLHA